jgi:PKD repeat protein
MRFEPSLGRRPRPPSRLTRHGRREGQRGQSMVELALVAPVLLLIVLIGIDFGRIYLGYINLQQMARLAANFAADNAKAWDATPDAAIQARYQELVDNDARAINCDLPRDGSGNLDVFDPVFPNGFDLGDPVEVRLTCQFPVITPIIGMVVGGAVEVGAGAIFPIKEGAVASVPGGGGGTIAPPTADFIATPTSGFAPLEVTFIDTSLNGPTQWAWDFGNGTATGQGPHTRTYTCTDTTPGTVCTFVALLTVRNSGGIDTSDARTITVTVPPDSGPIAEFEATPTEGEVPLSTRFDFVDLDPGATTYTNWEWDFDGDGTFDGTGQSVNHTYPAIGVYDVTLRVTDDSGATDTRTKTAYIVVTEKSCTVPDFFNVRVSNAQALWSAAGFTTTVTALPPANRGNADYRIKTQSILGGTIDPQPDGCDSTITVGP